MISRNIASGQRRQQRGRNQPQAWRSRGGAIDGDTGETNLREMRVRFQFAHQEDSSFMVAGMDSKENPGVPAGYLLAEITACRNGVVTLWRSPDGKGQAWNFDGPIRQEIARFARRHGLTFETAARALAETAFEWMALRS